MTDATAALYGVTAFRRPCVLSRAGRRIIRSVFDSVVIGIGPPPPSGVRLRGRRAAIWIVSTALATHPHLNERALIGRPRLRSRRQSRIPGAPMLPDQSRLRSSDHALTFDQQWSVGRATGSRARSRWCACCRADRAREQGGVTAGGRAGSARRGAAWWPRLRNALRCRRPTPSRRRCRADSHTRL